MSTLVDIKAMAKILSVKPSWIYANIQKRTGDERIPHFRVGKHLRFDPKAVSTWLDAKRSE
ncbi:MAG: helix-turn-helix domain-containing protein [Syntrophobacteraceae bacterium]